MTRVKEFYDADKTENIELPTTEPTKINTHPVYCGICGGKFFVGDVAIGHFNNVVEMSLENPFVCEDCESDYEDMSHGN